MSVRDYMAVVPPAGIRIPYGDRSDQFGDLRVPRGSDFHPVVVVVHGGWWRGAYDLTYAGHLAAAFAAQGIASWNIEYRRGGGKMPVFTALLTDVGSAMKKLEEVAPAHALDLSRLVVTGHSAGGHIAAWLASKQKHRELDIYGRTPPFIGAVPVAGALDLRLLSELNVTDSAGMPTHDLLGGPPAAFPDRYAKASPAELLPTGIPVVCIHGDADSVVPIAISENYVRRAVEAGDQASLIALKGVEHFAPFNPETPAGQTVIKTVKQLLRL